MGYVDILVTIYSMTSMANISNRGGAVIKVLQELREDLEGALALLARIQGEIEEVGGLSGPGRPDSRAIKRETHAVENPHAPPHQRAKTL